MFKLSDKKILYCGNNEEIPEGYDGLGSRYDCLKKGIGVGLYNPDLQKNKTKW